MWVARSNVLVRYEPETFGSEVRLLNNSNRRNAISIQSLADTKYMMLGSNEQESIRNRRCGHNDSIHRILKE